MKIDPGLRGAVYLKYPSVSAMARKMGWSRARLFNALSNPSRQSGENIRKILLAIDAQDDTNLIRFFVPDKKT